MSVAANTLYESALRHAVGGKCAGLRLVDRIGATVRRVDASAWCADLRPGDDRLLARCPDRTIDLGCGPGRLSGALVATGRRALGVDLSPQAVRYTRKRGAPAVLCDIFRPLPDEGRWPGVLLADGNIGIGGDPERLLRRCRKLVDPHGAILVELDPPGAGSWRGQVRLAYGSRTSDAFGWAFVSVDDIIVLAERAELSIVDTWTEADRWFAYLTP